MWPFIIYSVLQKALQKAAVVKFVLQTASLGIGLRKSEPERKARTTKSTHQGG